jgi:uncharacterized cofD-like protein
VTSAVSELPSPERGSGPLTPHARPPSYELGSGPRVVALGGGHGLATSLTALRRVTGRLTAVVTVADDGGSSGRLRRELGVLPPGDLRMALTALCGDDEWGRTWAALLQHRFASSGELHQHAVGNLLIVALWELLGEHVLGLDWVARLLGAHGRVLPMAAVPVDMQALVAGADAGESQALVTVRGQVAVATTTARVVAVSLDPPTPPACPEAVAAVRAADAVVLGPGSWFTSVIPHLLVPELAAALCETAALRVVTLNLAAQAGETEGFGPETHLEVLGSYAPDLGLDVVLADPSAVPDVAGLRATADTFGAELVLADLSLGDGTPRHHPDRLAEALGGVLARGRMRPWR